MRRSSGWRFFRFIYVLLLASIVTGCRCSSNRVKWNPPEATNPRLCALPDLAAGHSALALAESAYAEAIFQESECDASCVDLYFQAACLVWNDVENERAVGGCYSSRASQIYHSSVIKLITAGQEFQRFDPRCGTNVCINGEWTTIPTNYHGFAWRPKDFECLVPIGDYEAKDVDNVYSWCGIGVPTVALHWRAPEERFRRPEQAFPATVVLRPHRGESTNPSSFVIELYNPLSVHNVRSTKTMPLRRDITGSIAFRLKGKRPDYLNAFFRPGATKNDTGLFTIEPYQPGKIPVVFVHGLLSDPFTWVTIANEINARPEFYSRYQIWGFEYPTGEPFLVSAANLRRQLYEAQMHFDPNRTDAAISQIVLVGHSMGGLIAKLQVAHSGDQVWQSVADVPMHRIVAAPDTRSKLAEAFYFDPVPGVSRAVFIGTPHRGSAWAQRGIGRIFAAFVDEPSAMEAERVQLLRDNPGVFSREFARRIPTSIDLLRPSSPLLSSIEGLSTGSHVKLHSIIGSGNWMLGNGDSDGVVPVSSARMYGVETERLVDAKHTDIHDTEEGIEELLCILRKHLIEFDAVNQNSRFLRASPVH